jgi:uncharacterized protein YkwD
MRSHSALVIVLVASACSPGSIGPVELGGPDVELETGDALPDVEDELLAHINAERTDNGLPTLSRDPGMDRIEHWYAVDMLTHHRLNNHIDRNGRNAEARGRYYGGDDTLRCSEIIQWWGGTPDGQVHYEGYRNSPGHRSAYLEEGLLNLGPTSWAGVAVVAGYGPEGTEFEDRAGSYSGVMFCDGPVTLAIDPFSED